MKSDLSQEMQHGYSQESSTELEEYNEDVYREALADLDSMLR